MMLTTAEAAEVLKVSPSRIRQLIIAGKLKAYKRGRDLFLREADVKAYKRNRYKS